MGKEHDLIQAVKNNDIGTVRKILSKFTSSKSKKSGKKISINIQDEDGFTSLHLAALNGNTEITMALLDVPECNVNARDKKGMSPLHYASWAGKTEIAKLLVDYRACVNTCADTGDTPLHLACQHHNAGIVEILLDSNVDCTVVNKNGESPLDLACRFGHVQVVELLLKSQDFPKLLALFDENPKTADPPLHVACKTGREEIVVMLLDAGADVNQRGTNGTPLHEAALYGKTEVVKILLDNEADVSITNEEGNTPLDVVNHFTSSRAAHDIKELLREASKSKVLLAKAVHDYRNLYDPTCLSLKVGDTIEILEKNESGRWKGKVTNGTREIVGYFPSSMVKILSNPRKTSAKPLSMKDAGVLPIGKYELVTLPTVSEQSPPVHGKRPRMSSFGKPNDRGPLTPPTLPKADHRPISPPNPITNGIKENRLFQKTQESLQYVQVAVDNGPTSPTSPRSNNGSRPTQYAEVMLHNEVRDELRDKINATPPPSLPDKKYKAENGVKSESEDDDNIWIKNSSGQPELPSKTRSKTSSGDSIDDPTTNPVPSPVPQDKKPNVQDRKVKVWEKDLVFDEDLTETDLTTSSMTTHKTDHQKIAQHKTETLKPNYEDMTLNTPEKEQALFQKYNRKEHSPTKVDQSENGDSASPGLTRRQILSYENIELKGRPKDAIQSMLITEVDQDVEPPASSHNYENIHKGFEREKCKDVQDYESMIADDHMSKYETMKRGVSLENIADSSGCQDKPGLTQSDSYENVGVGALKTNSSSDYLHVNDQDEGPSHSYINISIPALPEGSSPSPSKQPSGLKMSEYNALYDWLESCKLAIYIDHFVKGGFDLISIAGLTPEDLTALNITKTGHRKKLLSESAKQKIADNVFPHEKPADIMTWLKLIHLDQYTPQLIDNGFDDLDFVQDITIEDLESIGITKPGHQRKLWLAVSALNSAQGTTSPGNPPEERYLETDLDQVHQSNVLEKKDKGRSTDIDSALSRLPADGASDSNVADEEVTLVTMETRETNTRERVDNVVASLQIESLAETRGSTPDLDDILDSLEDEQSSASAQQVQRKRKKSPGPFQITSRNQTATDANELKNSSNNNTELTHRKSQEVPELQTQENNTNINKSAVQITSAPKSTAQSSLHDKNQSPAELPETKPQAFDANVKDPVPFHLSPRPNIPDELNATENLSTNTSSQRTSTEVAEVISQVEKTKLNGSTSSSRESLSANSSPRRVFQARGEDTTTDGSTSSSHESLSPKSSPLRARHNSLQEKTGLSDTEERPRGMSFDSRVPSKKPPPPVKPKSFKKPPPKTAPKPKLSQSKSFESEMNKLENQAENDRTERRENIRPKQPPAVLPKTRNGSVHSTSSEGSIDSVIEELEQQKHYNDRRRSFEQLRKRFTDPESSTQNAGEDKSDQNKTRNNSTSENKEGLENQIKEVFRRSRENIVETGAPDNSDQPQAPTEPPALDVTDDDLERDQQITDDLMKDISSMLSDFSTEIDCMFDTTNDGSPTV